MTISKKINQIHVYPTLNGVANVIGMVDWSLDFTENGITSNGLVRTMMPTTAGEEVVEGSLTETQLLDLCTTIEGGDNFVNYVQNIHAPVLADSYKISTMKEVLTLDKIQEKKILELSQACEAEIVSGFTSNALGTTHTYQSDRDDQLNLIGMVTANVDDFFKCHDGAGWSYKLHTIAQLKQVLTDGKNTKLASLQRFNSLKEQVLSSTESEIELIVW